MSAGSVLDVLLHLLVMDFLTIQLFALLKESNRHEEMIKCEGMIKHEDMIKCEEVTRHEVTRLQ
jgi:hypothetical protein